jgi:hypothetical protein
VAFGEKKLSKVSNIDIGKFEEYVFFYVKIVRDLGI